MGYGDNPVNDHVFFYSLDTQSHTRSSFVWGGR
jgi:hypothetical protein